MDNGTMVETFKSLNYYQLAKTSLVSKRFRDLIRTNRHRLALLYDISPGSLLVTEIFNKRLSPEEYNQWVIRNQYSKQMPLEKFEIAGIQTMQHERRMYQLCANAGRELWNPRVVFFARAELNHENWPLFEHFTRFLTDPFVYLGHVSFDWTTQKEFFNWLSGIINPDRNRLQCHSMRLSIGNNDPDFPNLITWVKRHVLFDELKIEKELEIYQYREKNSRSSKTAMNAKLSRLFRVVSTGMK
ncbi:hypothetical protein DdX_19121 [Ditylenchus destructor]|uniref:F-box domain-containing protein n=1 Tax=Ditylenchus destructor TaxID=166010 RepID=A0AAD4MJ26_9BILA|nr:hypothetical protein DdX_19121 [Ditylenchus destructor]